MHSGFLGTDRQVKLIVFSTLLERAKNYKFAPLASKYTPFVTIILQTTIKMKDFAGCPDFL